MKENSVWKPIFLALLFIFAMIASFSYLLLSPKATPKVHVKNKEQNSTEGTEAKSKMENNGDYTHLVNQRINIIKPSTKSEIEKILPVTHKNIDNNQNINKTLGNNNQILTGIIVDENTSLKQVNLETISKYATDDIFVDKNGIIYLISNQNKKIYMWDIAKKKYIHTLPLKAEVISSAYSQELERLYMGYNTGKVNYIDLSSGSELKEEEFVDVRLKGKRRSKEIPSGIVSVGNYVFIHLTKCWSGCKLVFDKNSINKNDLSLKAEESWRNYSDFYIWDETKSRVYMADNYHDALKYIVINQDDGNLTEDATLLFKDEYYFSDRAFISIDGMRLLSWNGNIFNTQDLSLDASLNMSIFDAVWTDNKLFTIREVDDNTYLNTRSHKLEEVDIVPYVGIPLKLLRYEDQLIIITIKKSKIEFYKIKI